MDPITIAAIALLGSSGTIGGIAGAVKLWHIIQRAGFPKHAPDGTPITYEQLSPKEIAQEMAQRIVITHTLITVGQVQTGKRAVGEEVSHYETKWVRTGERRKVDERIVGYKKVGEREIGRKKVDERVAYERWVESPVPADRVRLRAIRGLHEIHQRVPAELVYPDEMQEMRILMGDAQVLVYQRRDPVMEDVTVPVTEDVLEPEIEEIFEDVKKPVQVPVMRTKWQPVFEPKTRKRKHAVYLLLDFSNSMFMLLQGNPWRGKLELKAAQEIFQRCVEESITFLCRTFTHKISDLYRWDPSIDPSTFMEFLNNCETGGTDIPNALNVAISDLRAQGVDSADLMLHTDGEDDTLSWAVRQQLNAYKIRLHVQLYGVDNESLRTLADSWSLCPAKRYLSQVIKTG